MEWPDLAPGTIHRSLFAAASRPFFVEKIIPIACCYQGA